MNLPRLTAAALLSLSPLAPAQTLPQINDAIQPFIDNHDISGAVTLVATPDRILHVSAQGLADIERNEPMTTDHVFWIASMTKPVTAVAVLMLQDEGKLSVDDPVSKYLPEFSNLKDKDGRPPTPTITLKHLLTHTAGLPENTRDESRAAKNLQDLVDTFTTKPMQFPPGSKWQYSQTAINSLGRIVEKVSGQSFPAFLDQRLFEPLGMKDTTFYPNPDQQRRRATPYNKQDNRLTPTEIFAFANRDLADTNRVPLANGGLFSTARDYARFMQMLLSNGTFDGKTYLKPETVTLMRTPATGTLETGFTPGNAWGLGVCVVVNPQGVTQSLSPNSYGHGGAHGTQAWLDPQTQLAHLLLFQRADIGNSDASDIRKSFHHATAKALSTKGAATSGPNH